jgi:hypothetical protein
VKEAEIAINAAEKLTQIKFFRWRAYAVAINATTENSSWIIEYYDPQVKAQMANSWRYFWPSLKGYGSERVIVGDGVVRVED